MENGIIDECRMLNILQREEKEIERKGEQSI